MAAIKDDIALRQARLVHSRKNTAKALAIFILPLIAYGAAFVAALATPLPWALFFSASLGWLTGMLFTVGHDACHQSFTSSRRLNGIIGRISMLPSLHNYSLWDLGHNRIHHRHNNVRGFDYVWEPMSPEDYRAASPMTRLGYRFLRSLPGISFYYAVAIWWPKLFLVRKAFYLKYGPRRSEYRWDGFVVWSFLVVELLAAWGIGALLGKAPIESIAVAVVIPFMIWNVLMSFVIYMHHTHPDVLWYSSVDDWREREGSVTGTVHVVFPWFFRKAMLDIMEHNAHHFAPGVPLYNLCTMQEQLPQDKVIEWQWTLPALWMITKACQLYDYDQRCWVGYPSRKAQQNTARTQLTA